MLKSDITSSKNHTSLSCNRTSEKDTGTEVINSGTNKKGRGDLGTSSKAITPPIRIDDSTSAKVIESDKMEGR